MNNFLLNKKHIHFIGIGGSGMYPLAQILHSQGYFLTGSDNNETDTLQAVRDMGIPVYLGQKAENIKNADLIIYTAAIMADNEELIAAKNSGVEVYERSELLGLVSNFFSNAICVCGTHGKTTATSMITQILYQADADISAIIGGKLDCIKGSGIAGKSETAVIEACEFVDTFLKLYPDTTVLLNIDEDHLDYFKNLENIIKSFNKFCSMTKNAVIVNGDDENSLKALDDIGEKDIITFGFSSQNNCFSIIKSQNGLKTEFDTYFNGELLGEFEINVPGKHNVLNATAAIATCFYNNIEIEKIKKGLSDFNGTKRRFEKIGEKNGITVCDDYAHHPAEIKVTLDAAKSLGYKRVIAVHQPFTYSRTHTHLDYFAEVLKIADMTILSEIMGSREKNTLNIYSKDLAEKINGAVWFSTFEEIVDYVVKIAKDGDLIITLGCGDIYKVAKMIIKLL